MKSIQRITAVALAVVSACIASQAQIVVPAVHSNIIGGAELSLKMPDGRIAPEAAYTAPASLRMLASRPKGTDEGIAFDFGSGLNGTVYYGLVDHVTAKYPQKVFFKQNAKVKDGKASIKLRSMGGKYDLTGWEKTGRMVLGYRLVREDGLILFDNRINVTGTGPFQVAPTIIRGPSVFLTGPDAVTLTLLTDIPAVVRIRVNSKEYSTPGTTTTNELRIEGLQPSTTYEYTVEHDGFSRTHSFSTAPLPGSRKPFSFAYASDSRNANGGGERNIHGANSYIMKKIAALAAYEGAAFVQFTGDLVNGYVPDPDEMRLQYHNWFNAIEPFSHYQQWWVSPGNHEAMERIFDLGGGKQLRVDRFPYETESSEALFREVATNPLNGPESEDGSAWDPDKASNDFPSYKEGVFHYTYDNVAMIALNSDYWYASTEQHLPISGGNPHGYIMDKQMEWLQETLRQYENDPAIDHIFVTVHTPAFPNGGHSHDDMWYSGNNEIRPWIAGKPVDKGIIERRDEILDLLVNQSRKTVAILCGDEHNYNRLRINDAMPRYPEGWDKPVLKLNREFWQLTNGAAGAPYYAQEQMPWTPFVEKFSTQYALVFLYVDGPKVRLKVINPDTLEIIEEYSLR